MMCIVEKLTHIAVTHIVYFFQRVLGDLEALSQFRNLAPHPHVVAQDGGGLLVFLC